jgi:predicted acylesterase/phospholipase RssA
VVAVFPFLMPMFLGRPSHPVASCFGGGGAFGVAFDMGVASALRECDIRVENGPMLGTSAGAWTAAALATGIGFEEVMDCWERNRRPGRARVIEISRDLFGDRVDGRVKTAAIQLATFRRTILSGADHGLAHAVAASSSPPGLADPHRIGHFRYIDAGVTRGTSADRAERAEVLVLVAPIGGRVLGLYGRVSEHVTHYEIAHWRSRTGGDVLFVRPTRAIASQIHHRKDFFDTEIAASTYRMARELGLGCVERFDRRHPATATTLRAA